MNITLTLNAQEDAVLRNLLNIALKAEGGPAAQAYVHFIARLDAARMDAMRPQPVAEPVVESPANDVPEAALAA